MIYKILCTVWQWFARQNDRLFRKNADFSGWMKQEEAGFTEKQGNQYQPCTNQLEKVLQKFSICKEDAILDIGCGKGKAMYLMSRFPFRKIQGYDLSEELVRIANQNFQKLGLKNCRAFQADAMEFADYDDFNYFFIFNSFPQKVFGVMMKHLLESVERRPRKVRFIYLNPVCHDYMEAHTPFRLIYRKKALLSWFTYHCYEITDRNFCVKGK